MTLKIRRLCTITLFLHFIFDKYRDQIGMTLSIKKSHLAFYCHDKQSDAFIFDTVLGTETFGGVQDVLFSPGPPPQYLCCLYLTQMHDTTKLYGCSRTLFSPKVSDFS